MPLVSGFGRARLDQEFRQAATLQLPATERVREEEVQDPPGRLHQRGAHRRALGRHPPFRRHHQTESNFRVAAFQKGSCGRTHKNDDFGIYWIGL